MKIIVAPDSFKGSLPADRVASAMAAGVRSVVSDAEIIEMPLADGGEGTMEVLVRSMGGQRIRCVVPDLLGRTCATSYGVVSDAAGNRTAVMDMASVCGLTLLAPHERKPMALSTEAVGKLMLHAVREQGCRHLILGIGGSATCDGGMGVAHALGARFFDREGRELMPSGEAMTRVARIDCSQMAIRPEQVRITVVCDVDAPLYGERGAAYVFAPQKGASPDEALLLDAGLRRYAACVCEATGVSIAAMPGAGAAGGVGAALAAFAGAGLQSGVATVLDLVGFREALTGASLVLTGEGRIDRQTLMGKVPMGVLRDAQECGVPVVALAGAVADGEALRKAGFAGTFCIQQGAVTLDEAMNSEVAARNLRETTVQILSLYMRVHGC